MAYGTFKGLKSKYYSEVTYTTDSAYSGISIFITDPKTMSLEEAIYTTGNKKPLAQMNPPGIAANKVVAKTNAAGFDTYGPVCPLLAGTMSMENIIYPAKSSVESMIPS